MPKFPIVMASCGCFGIPCDGQNLLVIQPCDGDNEIGFFLRELNEPQTYVPVSDDKAKELVRAVQQLIGGGYNFRQLRALLNIPEAT